MPKLAILLRACARLSVAALPLFIAIGEARAQDRDELRQMIQHHYEQMGQAFDAKDMAAYLAFFTADATTADTFGIETAAASSGQSLLLSVGKSNSRYTIDDASSSGDEAVSRATLAWDGDMVIGGTPYPTRMEMDERDTWTRASGDWRISHSQQLRSKIWLGDALILSREADLPPPAAERATLLAEIRSRAAVINSVEPESGFEDLEAIGAMIGDARIVALGEATHGSSAFFKMKHRLVEYLVEKKGFTVFAIESNWPETRIVDRYIKTGNGDADKVTPALGEPWVTHEVRDMVAWMRRYNASRGNQQPLSLFGFDMQSSGDAVKCVVGYFGRLGAADQAEVARLYEGPADIDATPNDNIPKLRAQAFRVVELLETRDGELAKVLNPEERLELSRCARHVTQAYELHASSSQDLRDALMAENARRMIEESYPGQKIMIWAHNGHVATWAPGPEKTMGAHLQDAFGDQLFVLGFAGEKGEVRARRIKGADYLEARRGQYVSLRLNPPVPFSAEALFAATGLDRFGLELRHVPPNSELARWLSHSHLLRDLGWAYDPDDRTYGYNTLTDLAAAYNALVFIAESGAAVPLVSRR